MHRLFLFLILLSLASAQAQSPREIEKTIADELELLVQQKLNKPALAKQLKLQYPITAPTMTEDEIQLKIDAATREKLATYKTKTPEDIAAAARERYPLYTIGDELRVTNRRGQTLRGTLRENSPRFVKLDDRLYSKVDLTDKSLLSIDEERNQAMVKRYISNQTNIQKDREKNTWDILDGTLGKDLRYEAGYARYRGRWMTAEALFERALVWKREKLGTHYRSEIAARVYTRFGYTRQEGEWVPPAEGTAAIVATDQQEDFFTAEPVAPPEPPPPATEPIAPPKVPADKARARDTVLNALKNQGAVEYVPNSANEIGSEAQPESAVSQVEPGAFEDRSAGAKAIDFANAKAPDAQLPALQSRLAGLRPEGGPGGGAIGLMELLLVLLTLCAAPPRFNVYFANKSGQPDLCLRKA
jgi:hypothetical protein